MTMNVSGIGNQPSPVRNVDRPASVKSESAPSGVSGNPGSDAVQLTLGSQTLIQMETDREPPVDDAKVAALRNAIAKGEYQVDSQRVAKKMFGLEMALST
ncbi:MAG: flagellar biosynthesis anti-sigma factor FlgM [Candidatus Contendobacter sp.]|jgi:negative regulator of flagellin synthesis FlgM|nr:flagellar biosynthesis anti-sigma factor FlgM [Gammaproteobacteria bacterium]MCC8994415.1 flagellar biosynthesis anti-sigma factor FlgM [Candidatus Contendobacter sp.]